MGRVNRIRKTKRMLLVDESANSRRQVRLSIEYNDEALMVG